MFGYSQREASAGGQLRKLVYLLAAASALAPAFASPQPLTGNLAATDNSILEARGGWAFSCFDIDESCADRKIGLDGTTKDRSSDVVGCKPIAKSTCTKYSFTGGGNFKLCLFDADDCTGDARPLDGSRVCREADKPESYRVVPYDQECF